MLLNRAQALLVLIPRQPDLRRYSRFVQRELHSGLPTELAPVAGLYQISAKRPVIRWRAEPVLEIAIQQRPKAGQADWQVPLKANSRSREMRLL